VIDGAMPSFVLDSPAATTSSMSHPRRSRTTSSWSASAKSTEQDHVPQCVLLHDFTRDGKADLLVGSYKAQLQPPCAEYKLFADAWTTDSCTNCSPFCQTAHFSFFQTIDLPSSPHDIEAADFDKNSYQDLVVSLRGKTDNGLPAGATCPLGKRPRTWADWRLSGGKTRGAKRITLTSGALGRLRDRKLAGQPGGGRLERRLSGRYRRELLRIEQRGGHPGDRQRLLGPLLRGSRNQVLPHGGRGLRRGCEDRSSHRERAK